MTTFKQFKLSEDLQKSIARLGFENPTVIQEKSIPAIIEGKDVLGLSSTGSGKTLAFGCGVIENTEPKKGIQSLILTPTRELAEQIKNSIKDLAKDKKLKVTVVYGGVSINPQIDALKKADIVIATPGRFKDHLQRRTVNPTKIKVLVLDEADRMLDMGFIEDIEFIINACPKKRQTLFFSATFAHAVEKLARRYLNNPVKIAAEKQVDPAKLKQVYYDVQANIKMSLLVHLIKHGTSKLVMVFCNTRRTTDIVEKNLRLNGINAIAIHGGLTQNKRTRTMEKFNTNKFDVLVCTDVAARGLHIDNVSHIYNYEIPNDPTDYVHRIGRTARAGKEGLIINLISNRDHDNFSRVMSEFRDFKISKLKTPDVERVSVKIDEGRQDRRGGFNRGGRPGWRGERPSGDRQGRSFGNSDRSGPRRSSSDRSGPRRSSSDRSGPRRSFGSGQSRDRPSGDGPRRSSSDRSGPRRSFGSGQSRGKSNSPGRSFNRSSQSGNKSGERSRKPQRRN